MKKAIATVLVLACVVGLPACSGKEKIWDWAQGLKKEEVISAAPWYRDTEFVEAEPLTEEEILELVTLLNGLTKKNFTQNKKGVGITPTVGLRMELSSGSCHINYAPSPYGKYGMLEIGFLGDAEMPYWIDDGELLNFFEWVTEQGKK